MLLVARLECAILLFGKRASLFASSFLEEGGAVWERGADLGRQMGLSVRVMLLVSVWEVCAEPDNVVAKAC
jgi:hypothetical protein